MSFIIQDDQNGNRKRAHMGLLTDLCYQLEYKHEIVTDTVWGWLHQTEIAKVGWGKRDKCIRLMAEQVKV